MKSGAIETPVYKRLQMPIEINLIFLRKSQKVVYVLDPRWNGLFLIICQKGCFFRGGKTHPF